MPLDDWHPVLSRVIVRLPEFEQACLFGRALDCGEVLRRRRPADDLAGAQSFPSTRLLGLNGISDIYPQGVAHSRVIVRLAKDA